MIEPESNVPESGAGFAEALESVGDVEGTGLFSRPDENAVPPPPMRVLEAIFFVGATLVTFERAKQLIRGLTLDQFQTAVDELNAAYRRQNRPYAIVHRPEGWALALKPAYQGLREKVFGGAKEARLSTAAVDVLALVAYRQPCTKAEVDTWRGADSGALLKQLVRRGLIHVVSRADADSREVAYGTTPRFLELFGLQSLDDLPKTQDLQQI